jgi:glycosyltransferase involved in cell wall biosynthesis
MALTASSILFPPGQPPLPRETVDLQKARAPDGLLISCLMVTRGDAFPAAFAIACFQRQTYPNRELIIVCDRPGSIVARHVEALRDPLIRYHDVTPASLGYLRNAALDRAQGALIAQWDDDDLSAPDRLAHAAAALALGDAKAVFLERWMLWWPARHKLSVSGRRIWEGSMLANRDIILPYPALKTGEDTAQVEGFRRIQPIRVIDCPTDYCYIFHGRNAFGAAHMDMLYANASMHVGHDNYDNILTELSALYPVSDYASALDVAGISA